MKWSLSEPKDNWERRKDVGKSHVERREHPKISITWQGDYS